MTFEDRVAALEALGFTERQTRFIATVALHSGFCLRRQYSAFAGIRYGKNVCDFLESLVARQLAQRFILRADRGLIYHVTARSIYRAIGEEDSRHRRDASAALMARKIMVLDYVLAHPELDWLATEKDKVDRFAGRVGVPHMDLPHRVFDAARPGTPGTVRYFTHKLPVAVAGDPPVTHFLYLALESTGLGLTQFLHDHERLFAWLPAWVVLAVGTNRAALQACQAVFEQQRQPTCMEPPIDDLRWFFATRQIVDRGALDRLSVASIDRFRSLRATFAGPQFEHLYLEWCRDGDVGLGKSAPLGRGTLSTTGRLVTELLPFDYSQFGSLPGVA